MRKPKNRNPSRKGQVIAVCGSAFLLVCAGLAIMFSVAITDGWEAVGAWFTSRYAMVVYLCGALFGLVIVTYFSLRKGKKDGRNG